MKLATRLALAGALTTGSIATAHAYEIDAKHQRVNLSSVEDFETCQNELAYSDVCFDALKSHVKAHPKDRFAAGKAVRRRFNHWTALQFFLPVLSAATPEQCEDEDLRLAVLSGLALPDDDPNAALAIKAAEGRCAAQLLPHVRNGFGDANSFYRKNACKLLAKQPSPPALCAPAEPAGKPAAAK
jgi:uncharacterized low-complexity protein